MISSESKLTNAILRLIQLKKWVNYHKPHRSKKVSVPGFILKKFSVSSELIKDKLVATISSKNNSQKKHIIFLHGGAYVQECSRLHWNFIEKLILATSYKVTFVDYPLAPEHTFVQTFEMVQKAYNFIVERFTDDEFILMGDSAGGGLALAFAQKLVQEKAKIQPIKLVLFSPWLDLSMSNPENPTKEKSDTILWLKTLAIAAKSYAGEGDMSHFLLSPINGNLNHLPPTAVFYGTDELFYPDCIKLQQLIKSSNSKFEFFEYEKMQHDFILFPIPEAKQALFEACQFIENQ